jgi:hypothetical protein
MSLAAHPATLFQRIAHHPSLTRVPGQSINVCLSRMYGLWCQVSSTSTPKRLCARAHILKEYTSRRRSEALHTVGGSGRRTREGREE